MKRGQRRSSSDRFRTVAVMASYVGGPEPPQSVHPRVCGELHIDSAALAAVCGSSPRVRGTPSPLADRVNTVRFIPACAGNSRSTRRPFVLQAVHPRVCGELGLGPADRLYTFGSSPRVRGTRRGGRRAGDGRRFIPACAGNSCMRSRSDGMPPVHPRVCGELVRPSVAATDTPGSSPRVRGTRKEHWQASAWFRFIPACAGNSAPKDRQSADAAVHPRVCGELGRDLDVGPFAVGSSPRVRGTLLAVCALAPQLAVHPRVCGELLVMVGSERFARRFIPACAGNSTADDASEKSSNGSSPRVRGTRNG